MVTARYDPVLVPSATAHSPLAPDGPFGRFANDLLVAELPDLSAPRRTETVEFVCGRVARTPAPLRLGLTVLARLVGLAHRVAGRDRVVTFLRDTRLPFVGELARLVRSLGFAYVWETWPDTRPTGAPG